MILIDTDVLIEFTRRDAAAIAWMSSLSHVPAVPGIVAIELLIGSRNRVELDQARRFVKTLDVRWHSPEDNALAAELVARHRLTTGIGLADYLIAAQALNLGATLYTFNLRHFGAIDGLLASAPYTR